MPANTTTTALNPTQSPNNAPWTTQPCSLFYWVFLAADLSPILGTMHAKNNNSYDVKGTPCTEARLTNYQMKPPAGHVQCFFKSGFRYFYLVNQQTSQIVPNSMISVSGNGKPKQMCIGTSHYLEFINVSPAPQP